MREETGMLPFTSEKKMKIVRGDDSFLLLLKYDFETSELHGELDFDGARIYVGDMQVKQNGEVVKKIVGKVERIDEIKKKIGIDEKVKNEEALDIIYSYFPRNWEKGNEIDLGKEVFDYETQYIVIGDGGSYEKSVNVGFRGRRIGQKEERVTYRKLSEGEAIRRMLEMNIAFEEIEFHLKLKSKIKKIVILKEQYCSRELFGYEEKYFLRNLNEGTNGVHDLNVGLPKILGVQIVDEGMVKKMCDQSNGVNQDVFDMRHVF